MLGPMQYQTIIIIIILFVSLFIVRTH